MLAYAAGASGGGLLSRSMGIAKTTKTALYRVSSPIPCHRPHACYQTIEERNPAYRNEAGRNKKRTENAASLSRTVRRNAYKGILRGALQASRRDQVGGDAESWAGTVGDMMLQA